MLTKIFIILLVMFSIAFTTMTVSIVAQSTNWRDTALKFQEEARIADTNLRHAHAAYAAQLASARDDVRAQQERISRLEAEKGKALQEAARVRAETAKIDSEKSSLEATVSGLVAQLEAARAGEELYRKQRDELEKRSLDRERRNIDLNDRVNELSAQLDVLLDQKRQFEQQIYLLQEENRKLASGAVVRATTPSFEAPAGAALPGVKALTPVPARSIRGRVVEVAGNLVTISVGSADGVKKDMIFVIHRDDEYVGDVTITAVDPNQSAGRLTLSRMPPQIGDKIADQATIGASRG